MRRTATSPDVGVSYIPKMIPLGTIAQLNSREVAGTGPFCRTSVVEPCKRQLQIRSSHRTLNVTNFHILRCNFDGKNASLCLIRRKYVALRVKEVKTLQLVSDF